VKKFLLTAPLIVLYPDDLYEEEGQLFCRICCHTINHVRSSTIDERRKSRKHCERKAAAIKKKIVDLDTAKTTCSDNEKESILDFVRCLTRADIPLEKAPAFQEFLSKYMKQEGTIPTPLQLYNTYLKELTPEHEAFLKKHVEDTDVG
uniref:Uncharacterized protein n=1 Tax=Callorhinchus milii TaxID=7868 RepID=A0A4W3HW17_CALMI